eukprot:gene21167-28063_t
MQRITPFLRQLQSAGAAEVVGGTRAYTTLGNFVFSSTADAPVSSLSSAIKVVAKGGKNVEASVSAGGASASAKYPVSAMRKLAATPTELVDAARISVLHSSVMDYLVKLSNDRYNVLASWPDFTAAYGKDFFYRSHPEDVKKFYAAADDFHRMYDVVTEFESLGPLASELLPAYHRKRMNTIHPAAGPATGNTVATQMLLSMK